MLQFIPHVRSNSISFLPKRWVYDDDKPSARPKAADPAPLTGPGEAPVLSDADKMNEATNIKARLTAKDRVTEAKKAFDELYLKVNTLGDDIYGKFRDTVKKTTKNGVDIGDYKDKADITSSYLDWLSNLIKLNDRETQDALRNLDTEIDKVLLKVKVRSDIADSVKNLPDGLKNAIASHFEEGTAAVLQKIDEKLENKDQAGAQFDAVKLKKSFEMYKGLLIELKDSTIKEPKKLTSSVAYGRKDGRNDTFVYWSDDVKDGSTTYKALFCKDKFDKRVQMFDPLLAFSQIENGLFGETEWIYCDIDTALGEFDKNKVLSDEQKTRVSDGGKQEKYRDGIVKLMKDAYDKVGNGKDGKTAKTYWKNDEVQLWKDEWDATTDELEKMRGNTDQMWSYYSAAEKNYADFPETAGKVREAMLEKFKEKTKAHEATYDKNPGTIGSREYYPWLRVFDEFDNITQEIDPSSIVDSLNGINKPREIEYRSEKSSEKPAKAETKKTEEIIDDEPKDGKLKEGKFDVQQGKKKEVAKIKAEKGSKLRVVEVKNADPGKALEPFYLNAFSIDAATNTLNFDNSNPSDDKDWPVNIGEKFEITIEERDKDGKLIQTKILTLEIGEPEKKNPLARIEVKAKDIAKNSSDEFLVPTGMLDKDQADLVVLDDLPAGVDVVGISGKGIPFPKINNTEVSNDYFVYDASKKNINYKNEPSATTARVKKNLNENDIIEIPVKLRSGTNEEIKWLKLKIAPKPTPAPAPAEKQEVRPEGKELTLKFNKTEKRYTLDSGAITLSSDNLAFGEYFKKPLKENVGYISIYSKNPRLVLITLTITDGKITFDDPDYVVAVDEAKKTFVITEIEQAAIKKYGNEKLDSWAGNDKFKPHIKVCSLTVEGLELLKKGDVDGAYGKLEEIEKILDSVSVGDGQRELRKNFEVNFRKLIVKKMKP